MCSEISVMLSLCCLNVLPLVFPAVRLLDVNPGVTEATVSWSVQRVNVTQTNLLCQVATAPLSTIQVNSFNNNNHTAEWKTGHSSAFCFFHL